MPNQGLGAELSARIQLEPFNAIATGIFVLAILHTFSAGRFTALAHRVQQRHDRNARAQQRSAGPSVVAELLHFFGEVEVVFGLWAIAALGGDHRIRRDWEPAKHYVNDTVNYTEPLFVVVIMALASTRPDHRLRRSGDAHAWRALGRRHAGRLVDRDPDHRAAARLVHHRAGGDDHLRAAARRGSSTTCSRVRASSTRRSACCSSTSRSAAR